MGIFPQTMHRRTFTALLGLCGIGLLPGLAHAAEKVSGKTTSSFSQGLADIRPTNPIVKDGCFNISPRDFGSKISQLSSRMNIEDDFFQILLPECKVAGDGTGLICVDFTAYEDSGAALDAAFGASKEEGRLVCRVHCLPKEDYRIASDSDYAETPGVINAFRCDDLDSGDSDYYVPYILFLMALLFNPEMPEELPFILDESFIDYAYDISSRCSDDNMTQEDDRSMVAIEADNVFYMLVYYNDTQTYRALAGAISDNNDSSENESSDNISDDEEASIGPRVSDGYFDISVREFANDMESTFHSWNRSSMSFTPVQDEESVWRIRVDDSNGLFATCVFLTPEGDLIQGLDPNESGAFKVIGIQLLSRSMLEDDLNSQLVVQVIARVLDLSLTEGDVTEILREIDQDTEPRDDGGSKGHTIKNDICYVLNRGADGVFTVLAYVDGALDYERV